MSRGGRGGFRGGKGAVEKTFFTEHDEALASVISTKPSETFPKIDLPNARPPEDNERASVHHYRTLRARIHDGPFYCIIDPSARVSKSSRGGHRTPRTALFDPFEEQPTYSQKFKKQRNHLPNLHKRPFVQEFFPQELWETIGVGIAGEKTHQLSKTVDADEWMDVAEVEENKDADGDEDVDEEKEAKADEDGDKEDDDEDKDPDQFDEDDEDEDDDYNAEQYFSGGEDDDYGDEGGGGGGDEDF
ncbi:Calcium channel YVC1 [Sphaceloma murrayae]|uniref:DNA-directed RNA polymerase III subunit n=1 Tax=Sphaceloma murrayae TaxID=2082308 RepID=A0A2K1R0C1_9PEZI|nr:Calcium channel YVC1 [Sphaceloma murrayae]